MSWTGVTIQYSPVSPLGHTSCIARLLGLGYRKHGTGLTSDFWSSTIYDHNLLDIQEHNATFHGSVPIRQPNMAGIENAGIVTSTTTKLPGPPSHYFPTVTTPFTYATSCGSQWLQLSPDASVESSRSVYVSEMYFNTNFLACQPGRKQAFSPGVCPSGYYMAGITEYNDGNGGSSRLWGAMCCGK
jgi:hypothetical protein